MAKKKKKQRIISILKGPKSEIPLIILNQENSGIIRESFEKCCHSLDEMIEDQFKDYDKRRHDDDQLEKLNQQTVGEKKTTKKRQRGKDDLGEKKKKESKNKVRRGQLMIGVNEIMRCIHSSQKIHPTEDPKDTSRQHQPTLSKTSDMTRLMLLLPDDGVKEKKDEKEEERMKMTCKTTSGVTSVKKDFEPTDVRQKTSSNRDDEKSADVCSNVPKDDRKTSSKRILGIMLTNPLTTHLQLEFHKTCQFYEIPLMCVESLSSLSRRWLDISCLTAVAFRQDVTNSESLFNPLYQTFKSIYDGVLSKREMNQERKEDTPKSSTCDTPKVGTKGIKRRRPDVFTTTQEFKAKKPKVKKKKQSNK